MIIELRGVEFHNKGAELMLLAIIEQIKKEMPNAKFAMENTRTAPRAKHLNHDILTITGFEFRKLNKLNFFLNTTKIYGFLPQAIRRKLGYITEDEVNVVLDGSGFAFGDQWGAVHAGQKLSNYIQKWKSQNKKIILLPQAFGPFKDESLRDKMRLIAKYSDLIFARDILSYEYIKDVYPEKDNVKLRPDFTNLIQGYVPTSYVKTEGQIAVIPNSKMISGSNKNHEQEYYDLLQNSVEMVQNRGFKPFFLIHEGKNDIKIAEALNTKLKQKIPVIIEENPLAVKGIIGISDAIITSRFHGLVSALSQSVPCLATSWSHKYQMLLENYDYKEGLLTMGMSNSELESKLDLILNKSSTPSLIQKLTINSKKQKEESLHMWNEVIKTINS